MHKEFFHRPVTTTLKCVAGRASVPAGQYADFIDHYYSAESTSRYASLERIYGIGLVSLGALIEGRGRRVNQADARRGGRLIQELPVLQVVANRIDDEARDDPDYDPDGVLANVITRSERELDGTGIPLENILKSNQRMALAKGLFHEGASNWFSNYAAGWSIFLGLLASPQFREMVDTSNVVTSAGVGLSAIALGAAARVLSERAALDELGYSSSIVSTLLHHSYDPELPKEKRAAKAALWATALDIAGAYALPQHNFAMFMAPPYSFIAYPISVGIGDELSFAAYNLALRKGRKVGGFVKRILKR